MIPFKKCLIQKCALMVKSESERLVSSLFYHAVVALSVRFAVAEGKGRE